MQNFNALPTPTKIIIAFALAVVIFVGAFLLGIKYDEETSVNHTAPCTEEAKLCPDGSSVGRVGPTCEFAACPEGTPVTPVQPPTGGGTKKSGGGGTKPVACSTIAKLCPDGSSVSRTGPLCEFAKCPSPSTRPLLKGTAMVGPTCPVVRVPDDGTCADKPYEGSLEVWNAKGGFEKSFVVKKDGTFETELTPGSYTVRPPKGSIYPRLTVVASFTMEAGKITEIVLTFDSGIR